MTQTFPIDAIKDEFLCALEQHNTLILTAPPGAGKSTRLPLWLLSLEQYKNQKIYLLQPRRVAAKNIACYLSEQLREPVGQTVGYRLKNESKVSHRTRLEVITEGILTQIIQNDAELNDCGLVILDEFHERSLQGDLAFALARDVQQAIREDLQLVIMSATLSIKALSNKLPDAITLTSEGRSFPVDVEYIPLVAAKRLQQHYSTANQWREHALTVITQQVAEHQGSILVFLPGVADIKYLHQNLTDKLSSGVIELCPLYGELSIAEQQKAIAPAANGKRKLVLATNIAETSLTIEGVTLVIDCGFEKTAVYDPKTLINKLQQQVISKASATQRAGRAGRLSAGKCIRLYSQEDFSRRDENSKSEIQHADLLPFVIEAARWGVTQLSDLPLIELPNAVKEQQAWQELQSLNIVTSQNQLTTHGKLVAGVACHPRFAHMIIMAKVLEQKHKVEGLVSLACLTAVLLEERDIFTREQSRFDCNLTHRIVALVNIKTNEKIRQHHAYQMVKQANQLAKKFNSSVSTQTPLPVAYTGVLLALAYPERIAKYRYEETSSNKVTKKRAQLPGEYLTTAGKGITINDEDTLLGEPYIVAAQVSENNITTREAKTGQKGLMVQLAAPVDIEQLIDWDIVQTTTEIDTVYNAKVDRITAQKLTKINALVIDEQAAPEQLNSELISRLWAKELTKQGLTFLALKEKDHALLLRWRWLTLHNKTIDLPSCDEENLLANLDTACFGLNRSPISVLSDHRFRD